MAIKPRFDISQHTDENDVMMCESREQSQIFREYLDKQGRVWASRDRYTDLDYDKNIDTGGYVYYYYNKNSYGTCEAPGINVRHFDDFLWDDSPQEFDLSFEDMLGMVNE